ncbi:MAG: ClbS/DfsB family four-helix bundle protein [Chloroflexi bacterium]|nr:ClbS/DfsB family four-helix bundle protein [Chloroflexota bacterium]
MKEQMTKTELIERLRTERARWEALLDAVGETRMMEPLWANGWSTRDLIGHVTYYERWLLNWLEAAVRGQVTVASHRDLLDVDQRNALIQAENKDRSLPDLLKDSRSVFERLLQVVQLLPEHDLLDPHRFERYIVPFWEKSLPLWECIAGDSYEHYREHIPSIRELVESQPVLEPSLRA